jgi:hypothetical protein
MAGNEEVCDASTTYNVHHCAGDPTVAISQRYGKQRVDDIRSAPFCFSVESLTAYAIEILNYATSSL